MNSDLLPKLRDLSLRRRNREKPLAGIPGWEGRTALRIEFPCADEEPCTDRCSEGHRCHCASRADGQTPATTATAETAPGARSRLPLLPFGCIMCSSPLPEVGRDPRDVLGHEGECQPAPPAPCAAQGEALPLGLEQVKREMSHKAPIVPQLAEPAFSQGCFVCLLFP